jgi:tetrahydromethanopterin S-methyltransferase subunit B
MSAMPNTLPCAGSLRRGWQNPETFDMKKPRTSSAEKAARDLIFAEVRSLNAQIANLEPIANSLFEQINNIQVTISRLRVERDQLKAQASSPYPLP